MAGKKCYVLAYHINGLQDIMQQKVRAKLNRYRETISRPFYAIDIYVPEQFLFVYLDEGADDPIIYEEALLKISMKKSPALAVWKLIFPNTLKI